MTKFASLRPYFVYIGFAVIFIFFAAFLHDDGFLSTRNLTNIILQTAPVTVMAVGLVFVLSAGEIDISFGSTVALSALAAAVALAAGAPFMLGAAVGLSVGVLVGVVNGVFVAYMRLPSFLVTLAMLGLIAGVARTMTDLRSVPVINDAFIAVFGSGTVLGAPVLVLWTGAAVAVGHFYYRETRYGAHVLACGDNPAAAAAAGINLRRVRMSVLMLSGACAGLAGLLYAGRVQSARYTFGESDLMTVLAAVIVGGTRLNGGYGSVVGALIGSLLMGMLNNGLILMGLSVSEQMIVRGGIILVAVAASLRDTKGE